MSGETLRAQEEFLVRIRELYHLHGAVATLNWDQHTHMPSKAAPLRAGQLEALAGVIHERTTDPRLVALLDELSDAGEKLDAGERVDVRETRRIVDRALRVPRELVREISRTQPLAQQHWLAAREKTDFGLFAPWLEKMITLKRRVAEALGYEQTPYDPLLDEYEPHVTTAQVDRILTALRPRLVEIARTIADSGLAPRRELLERTYPLEGQQAFGAWLLRHIGYDFAAGRIDVAPHPFTIGNLWDVRITTRYRPDRVAQSIFATLHEGGHALYEQGFDPARLGTPRAAAASQGIHESQSRLWENLVGRSLAFWEYAFPFFQAFFPDQTQGVTLEDWYRAVNDVRPSCIRVEADEVTYNLHIILRFELERALIEGRLRIADLPAAWNEGMREFLGVEPSDDREGVLQDVHWAMGLFGYFPTYALGNLYAAQFFETALREMPDLMERLARGDLLSLKSWANERIHRPGQTERSADLVKVVTGEEPSAEYLISHLRRKYSPLYGGWA
jgi:carboxypeptidase Taq